MIVELLMNLLGLVFSVLPSWTPLEGIGESIAGLESISMVQQVVGIITFFNRYVPVAEGVVLFGVAASLLALSAFFRGVTWLWRNLPGKMT